MSTSVAERGPDVGEVAKDYDQKLSVETIGGKKDASQPGLRNGHAVAQLVPSGVKYTQEAPPMKSAQPQRVDESQDPLKSKGGNFSEAEGVFGNESNGTRGSQIFENGDGDLPSFSIKRLRRLPVRATVDQQSDTLDSKAEPTGTGLSRDTARSDKEETRTMGEGVTHDSGASLLEAESANADGNSNKKKVPFDPHIVGAADSVGDSVDVRKDVQMSATLYSSGEEKKVSTRLAESLEGGLNPVSAPGARIEQLPDKQIGVRNPDSVGLENSIDLHSPYLLDGGAVHDLLGREERTGHELQKDSSGKMKEGFAASNPLPGSMNPERECEAERWRNVFDTYTSESIPHENPPALSLQVEDPEKENVATQTPEIANSPPAGIASNPEKDFTGFGSPASSTEGDQDARLPDDMQVPGELDTLTLLAPSEPVAVSAPGIVQILPPVLGQSFESPEETTDEDDSPRSSLGFAHPGEDPDLTPLPYSGPIVYPGRFSSSQSPCGPSILHYAGSMSLRSDSSTTSTRSFAFPILAPSEWNSSPVRMAKADPRYLRRRRRWDGCCFFRFGRSRHKY